MKFKRFAKPEQGLQFIAVTPLIDCIFLLIIFFLFASSLTVYSSIDVKLPKAVTSEIVREENVVILITSENIVYYHNKVVALSELKKELSQSENKKRLILIKADHRASVGRIVDIWNLCRHLGIERINIVTNRE